MQEIQVIPTRAYDLLDNIERKAVDDYVTFAVNNQRNKRERIINALYTPIPSEYLRRSRDALYKPLLRAAISERIKEEADKEDMSPDRVIRERFAIATAHQFDFMEIGEYGDLRMRPKEDLPVDKFGAIKSLETKPGPFGMNLKIVLHDKEASLKALSDMMGISAADTHAVLQDYVSPPRDNKLIEQEPEKAYIELLESMSV